MKREEDTVVRCLRAFRDEWRRGRQVFESPVSAGLADEMFEAIDALDRSSAAQPGDAEEKAIKAMARVEDFNRDQRMREVALEEIGQSYGVLRGEIEELGKALSGRMDRHGELFADVENRLRVIEASVGEKGGTEGQCTNDSARDEHTRARTDASASPARELESSGTAATAPAGSGSVMGEKELLRPSILAMFRLIADEQIDAFSVPSRKEVNYVCEQIVALKDRLEELEESPAPAPSRAPGNGETAGYDINAAWAVACGCRGVSPSSDDCVFARGHFEMQIKRAQSAARADERRKALEEAIEEASWSRSNVMAAGNRGRRAIAQVDGREIHESIVADLRALLAGGQEVKGG